MHSKANTNAPTSINLKELTNTCSVVIYDGNVSEVSNSKRTAPVETIQTAQVLYRCIITGQCSGQLDRDISKWHVDCC